MALRTTEYLLARIGTLFVFLVLCFLSSPPHAAVASATLQIVRGSGDVRTLVNATNVSAPESISFQWTTTETQAVGGTWKVTKQNSGSPIVVSSGDAASAPHAGDPAIFTIPASGAGSFLASSPPSKAVKYTVTIQPYDASHQAAGAASPAVTVTQQKAHAVHFPGINAVYPGIELIRYEEDIGHAGSDTQILSANATVTVRGVNKGTTKTHRVGIQIQDWNNLWQPSTTHATIGSLKPKEVSNPIKIQLVAALPPPKPHEEEPQQVAEWQTFYKDRCGVDLRVEMNAGGTAQEPVLNSPQQEYLYLGYGNSKPWEEHHIVSQATVCDATQCVHLNDVARSIYKQLACHVVGYAFFVGNSLEHQNASFDSYGLARTRDNKPAAFFGPNTKMQIASSSKVLTTLAAIKVIGDSNLDSFAYKKFPSSWHLPHDSIVKKITYRDFLAQSSGVKQYNTGPTEADADLKAFFTQPIPDPNAIPECTGADATIPIAHPIEADKSPCYSNTNFSIMRVLIPRFAGETTHDATKLADKYVRLVREKVFTPVGATNVACKAPSSPADLALPYKYPGTAGADWGDLTTVCGAWGWHVSVKDYARVLLSLNSADHRILNDCQFLDMQTNPAKHPLGWDVTTDQGTGMRWLEKNGADGMGSGNLQTTSVTIYGGSVGTRSHGTCTPGRPGVVGVLFINSQISGSTRGADTVLLQALRDGSKPNL